MPMPRPATSVTRARSEAALEQDADQAGGVEAVELGGGAALADSGGAKRRKVDAAAVVLAAEDDVAAAARHRDRDAPARRLAGGDAVGWRARCRARRRCGPAAGRHPERCARPGHRGGSRRRWLAKSTPCRAPARSRARRARKWRRGRWPGPAGAARRHRGPRESRDRSVRCVPAMPRCEPGEASERSSSSASSSAGDRQASAGGRVPRAARRSGRRAGAAVSARPRPARRPLSCA